MGMAGHNEALRGLPALQGLLEHAQRLPGLRDMPRAVLVAGLRGALAEARSALLAGSRSRAPDARAILDQVAREHEDAPRLRPVLNATGIVVHTNLGRAPLADAAIAAAAAAAGACTLEFDLRTGRRGARGEGAEMLLQTLTGAEAAIAVNNNAAAMLLALTALAGGEAGEVIVSRGELVEIGGGFRIPDIIGQGGARLVEVGTTNKTRLADYEAAITPRTRLLLKVHQSNFRMVGFTAEATLGELAGLARERGLILLNDLGSGMLSKLPSGLAQLEPTVRESLEAGSNVVAFSGDKLLGGPQAGLLAGCAEAIGRMRRHPLMRALRLDKLTLAALEATLRLHAGPDAARDIPVLRMLAQGEAVLQARAERLCALLGSLAAGVVVTIGHAGGGALPGQDIASRAVALRGDSPDRLARELRAHGVIGRIREDVVLLDVLTLGDEELEQVAQAVKQAVPF